MFVLILVLFAAVAAVAALVAWVTVSRVRDEIVQLQARLLALENRFGAVAAAVGVPEQAVETQTAAATESAAAPVDQQSVLVAAESASAGAGFEEQFGTRWTVWVGGLALALGGVFLVRYSIEQGWLGPGVRIFLGGLLAAVLIAAGEWTRRQESLFRIAALPSAHIPAILTAAGTTVAYATVYAAYALYDFLPPAAAFVLLGVTALATLAAALLHGPALAALGIIGAYVAPVLVETQEPNFVALYVYLAVVTGAAFAFARARLWRWLAVTAIAAGLLWLFVGLGDPRAVSIAPHAFFVVAAFVLAAALIVNGFLFGPEPVAGDVDGVSSGSLAAFVLGAALIVVMRDHDTVALVAFAAVVVGVIVVAWRAESATGAVFVAAVLCALIVADWAVNTDLEHLVAPPGPLAGAVPDRPRADFDLQLFFGFGFAVLFGVAGFFAQGRSEKAVAPMLWATSAVLAPVAILIALYYRIAAFDQSVPFAALALALAAIYGLAVESLTKRPARPGSASAAAIFAVGSIAGLALALTMALEEGWLTIALALMVPGIAYVAEKRPLPVLRQVAALICTVVLARVAWEPRVVSDVGITPIFNWLLWGYGIPALSFWIGGYLLRRRADDMPSRMADALAVLFTVLLVGLQIRHYVNGGNIYASHTSLVELALQVCFGLAMAIGLERLRLRTASVIHDYAALAIAGATLALIVGGLLVTKNPAFIREPVHGVFFNSVLLGYAIPAALAAALAFTTRSTRPASYGVAALITALVLALAYLTLEVRALFHGPMLSLGRSTDAEQYAYSAVWLAFGVVLLFAGIVFGSKTARLASAAVVTLTIAKVFLLDMSGLDGAYRALSFIGLGAVLVGIGWLYQRLLFPAGRGEGPLREQPS